MFRAVGPACFLFAFPLSLPAWAPKQAPIMTKWAAQVDPANVLPDYPRPQMVRADWLNLNGIWQYQPGAEGDALPEGKTLSGEILVPFAPEAALSGVMEHHERLWYRRTVTVPAAWKGKRVLLHFGAVDWESEIFVNGKSACLHQGGYDPFDADITPFLKGDGPQELIVRVYDPTEGGGQPRGKQTTQPGGIMYTPVTGIWQTVWLEPVAAASIHGLHIVPDIDAGTVAVTVSADGAPEGRVKVTVKDGVAVVRTVEGKAGEELRIPVPNAKLWSPDSPFLYGLDVVLNQGGAETDKVGSYFGMRKISLGVDGGVKKMFLNNKFVFEMGPLDQGFWPDGIYTAPTEAAMKNDIEQMKALGFNMVRKHIKVEPARWYYWTDKLGLLVWQDMPSSNSYLPKEAARPPIDVAEDQAEWKRIIAALGNTPSIVMWVTFNESQGQSAFDTVKWVGEVQALDPSRLVNEASGDKHFGAGDVLDIHRYPTPGCPPPSATQALACGEYGGIGFQVKGHLWLDRGGGYTNVASPDDLVYLYADFMDLIRGFRDKQGMSAAVYTQLTDVETELNGLMTYDRVPKCDFARIARASTFTFAAPSYRTVLPTAEAAPQAWKYTTEKPPGNWNKKEFDDAAWTQGNAGFGKAGPLGGIGNTPWATSDIWLRRHFNPGNLSPEEIAALVLRDYHDDDVQVFLNGVRAYAQGGFLTAYEMRGISDEARQAVVPNADNVIAVHCLQKGGGQYIDAGLSVRVPAGK